MCWDLSWVKPARGRSIPPRAQRSISSLSQPRTGGIGRIPLKVVPCQKEEGMRLLKNSNSTYFQIFLAARPHQSLPLNWKALMALVLYQISTHTVCCSIHPSDLDGNRLARLHKVISRGKFSCWSAGKGAWLKLLPRAQREQLPPGAPWCPAQQEEEHRVTFSTAQPSPGYKHNFSISELPWQFFSIRSGKPRSLLVFSRIVPIVWF